MPARKWTYVTTRGRVYGPLPLYSRRRRGDNACKAGNIEEAVKLHMDMLLLGQAVYVENYPSGLKEAMEMVGRDGGVTREPLGKVSSSSKQKIENVLRKINLIK